MCIIDLVIKPPVCAIPVLVMHLEQVFYCMQYLHFRIDYKVIPTHTKTTTCSSHQTTCRQKSPHYNSSVFIIKVLGEGFLYINCFVPLIRVSAIITHRLYP